MRAYTLQLQAGATYEAWTLLRYIPSKRDTEGRRASRAYWVAKCSCGTEQQLRAEKIMDGTARGSCGCKPRRVMPATRPHPPAGPAVNSVFALGTVAAGEAL